MKPVRRGAGRRISQPSSPIEIEPAVAERLIEAIQIGRVARSALARTAKTMTRSMAAFQHDGREQDHLADARRSASRARQALKRFEDLAGDYGTDFRMEGSPLAGVDMLLDGMTDMVSLAHTGAQRKKAIAAHDRLGEVLRHLEGRLSDAGYLVPEGGAMPDTTRRVDPKRGPIDPGRRVSQAEIVRRRRQRQTRSALGVAALVIFIIVKIMLRANR